jgi:hypothetical protein
MLKHFWNVMWTGAEPPANPIEAWSSSVTVSTASAANVVVNLDFIMFPF